MLPAIIGTSTLDPVNVVIAMTIFGVALMARSAADAIDAVDQDVVGASEALGYSPAQRFFKVELPLAGPVLLAGIRVVSVAPTFVRTAMTATQLDDPELGPALRARIPLGRWATPEEVAAAVRWAASPEAGMLTGTSLVLDGGWTAG